MKNILEYYYNIYNINFHKKDNKFFFTYNNTNYLFMELLVDIRYLLYINSLINTNDKYDKIIYNKFGNINTIYKGKPFVLFRMNNNNSNIEKDILEENKYFILKFNTFFKSEWSILWSEKIDYIEYQLKHIEDEFPLIRDSINYYIGMGETAIAYFNSIYEKDKMPNKIIVHRRICSSLFNNPTNLILDYHARDIAEYLKYLFFSNNFNYDFIDKFLKKLNLTQKEAELVYARLLFPTFYFDEYDRIIRDNSSVKNLKKIISTATNYENYINYIFLNLKRNFNIRGVEWLNYKF